MTGNEKNDPKNATSQERLEMSKRGEVAHVELMPKGSLESPANAYAREVARREKAGEQVDVPPPFDADAIIDAHPTVQNVKTVTRMAKSFYARLFPPSPETPDDPAAQKEAERLKQIERSNQDFVRGR